MTIRTRIIHALFSLFILLAISSFSFVRPTLATGYQLSGAVNDEDGAPISGATVDVFTAGTTNNIVPNTESDSLGRYIFISIPNGTYDIKVTPPTGSQFTPAIAFNQSISGDTLLTFVLTPSGIVKLSGHVYGPLGNVVPNQTVSLTGSDGNTAAVSNTDDDGVYSLTVSPGTYTLRLYMATGAGNAASLNVPQYYDISVPDYAVTQTALLDLTIPAKRVNVSVKDPLNAPVANVELEAKNLTLANEGGLTIATNITNASGTSTYYSSSVKTDSATGNAVLWLLPNNSTYSYVFTAIPPSGSDYHSITIPNVTITTDRTLDVTISHAVTLSGHVYGPLGNVVPNQTVSLTGSDGNTAAVSNTDDDGVYSLTVSPGTYTLRLYMATGAGNAASLNVPQYYDISVPDYAVTQTALLDLTIPAKRVNVSVKDPLNAPVANVELEAKNLTLANEGGLTIATNITNASGTSTYYSSSVKTDSATGNAVLWLLPNNSTYSYVFTAIPPSGSDYHSITIPNVTITTDRTLDVTISHAVTLSGHVYGPLGNVVPNQTVSLTGSDGNTAAVSNTDDDGVYSLTVSPGTYTLRLYMATGAGNAASLNVPQYYDISVPDYAVTQTALLDLTIPAKRVNVSVKDPLNAPVANVELEAKNLTLANEGGLTIATNITNASGTSTYYSSSVKTDSATGNAVLWLLPNNSTYSYVFTAIPPSGSDYVPFTINGVSVTDNQTEIISLQYLHPPLTINPAQMWIGLKNSDDQGTQFDLRTQVYVNGEPVSEGINRCISGVTRNPDKAKEVAVTFGTVSPETIEPGDVLSFKVSTRIGTNPDDTKCPGHNNAVGLRLYYDSANRPSGFEAEVTPQPLTDYFLHSGGLLNTTTPTNATAKYKDSTSLNFSGGNNWKEIGAWTMTLP